MIDRTETESMLDLGSQHLADNESIHGSLAQSYENHADIGISMVLQTKVETEQPNEDIS